VSGLWSSRVRLALLRSWRRTRAVAEGSAAQVVRYGRFIGDKTMTLDAVRAGRGGQARVADATCVA
jgi:hypothetical protein